MAIYHFTMSNGKVGKGSAHYDYIAGKNEYGYKENEVIFEFNKLPDFASSPEEFWKSADENERVNGRVYKEIRLALPHELTLEENKELLKEYLDKEFKDHYYSVVIHDKESSVEGINNIHAHIMICPRKIDGIERSEEQFFKRYNSKYPDRGGAEKDKYFSERDFLVNQRKSWEETLNKTLEKKGIEKVSSLSLKEQQRIAKEKGELAKVELLDREAINVDGYILQKSSEDLNEMEKAELNLYLLNKEIKENKELLYNSLLEYEQLLNAINESKNINIEVGDQIKEFENKEKEKAEYCNIYDIQTNILMLEIEKKYLENTEENKEKLFSINIELDKNYKILEKELDKLNDQQFEEKYRKLNTLSFEKDYFSYVENSKNIIKLEREIKNLNSKLENLDDITYSILSNGEYGKLKKKMEKLENIIADKYALGKTAKDEEKKYEEIKEQMKSIKSKFNTKKGKNTFIRKKYTLEKEYKKSLKNKSIELEKSKILKDMLFNKIDLHKKEDYIYETKKQIDERIININNKLRKLEGQLNVLNSVNIKNNVLNKLSNNEYFSKLDNLKKLKEKEKNTEEKIKNLSFIDIFSRSKLQKELVEIKNGIKDIENEVKEIREFEKTEEFKTLFNNQSEKHFNTLNNVTQKIEELKTEKYTYINFAKEFNKEVTGKEGKSKVSGGGLKANCNSNFNKNLGEVKNTGNGLKISSDDDEDSWEKRMKKEMDFSI